MADPNKLTPEEDAAHSREKQQILEDLTAYAEDNKVCASCFSAASLYAGIGTAISEWDADKDDMIDTVTRIYDDIVAQHAASAGLH